MADAHAFSTKVACSLGVPGAIVLQHFLFLQQSAAGSDGDIFGLWVKRSARSIAVTYPYWNAKQIHHILSTLEADAVLASKIENDYPGDRTKSYTITQKGFEILGIDHFQKREMVFKKGKSDVQKKEMHNSYNSLSFSSSTTEAETVFDLEAEKEKNTSPHSAAPSPPLQKIHIPTETANLKADWQAKEAFALVRKIPSDRFERYADEFAKEKQATLTTYNSVEDFRKNFLNWAGIHYSCEQKKQGPTIQPAQRGKQQITRAGSDEAAYLEKQAF